MTNPVVPIRQDVSSPLAPERQPEQIVAASSILGLFAFACVTWVVAASMVGWYGNSQTYLLMLPFAALFGGLAEFLAGMWAFRARDIVASSFHGIWGAFWLAFGLIGLMTMARLAPVGDMQLGTHLGWWLVVLAVTTWVLSAAAFRHSLLMGSFVVLVALGATLGFIGDFANSKAWSMIAGYCWLISAVLAWIGGGRLLRRMTRPEGSAVVPPRAL